MTLEELRARQRWTLDQKVDHAVGTLEAFVSHCGGLDKVYVSFSGGKDSTVLLHIARRIFPNILAVFSNTGNEYPEIVKFARWFGGDNLAVIRPRMTPRQVWEKYGFPLVSKEVADMIHRIRSNPDSVTSQKVLTSEHFRLPLRWRYLIDEPYETTGMCCTKLKKEPFHRFEKETGRSPILGVMASESQLREKDYIRHGGCNVFAEGGRNKSQPLSIWTDDDVWAYIRKYNVPIAEIYHKGAKRTGCVGCGFGAHNPGDGRFTLLRDQYPKAYAMVMSYTNNGETFREALRKALAVTGKTLPDEEPTNLFTI